MYLDMRINSFTQFVSKQKNEDILNPLLITED